MEISSPMFTIGVRDFDAVLFDLDGVVTRTAKLHAAAWKALFDGYLRARAARENASFQSFDIETDYRQYVDGKPRYDGVASFLAARHITLPYGNPDDPPEQETVCGLGNQKNDIFHECLAKYGVEVFDTTVELIHDLKAYAIKTAIVSSSKNCAAVLEAAGLSALFDTRVDGVEKTGNGKEVGNGAKGAKGVRKPVWGDQTDACAPSGF